MKSFFIQGLSRLEALLLTGLTLLVACAENSSSHTSSQQGAVAASSPMTHIAPLYGVQRTPGDTVRIHYTLQTGATPDSVVLAIEGQRIDTIGTAGYVLSLPKDQPMGRIGYTLSCYTGTEHQTLSGELRVVAPTPPTDYTYRVLKSYPHDPQAYTQGLLWHNGSLYESTGLEGGSSLRKVALTSGKILQYRAMPESWFAEGLALLQGKLYQLTWQNGIATVYDQTTFDPQQSFNYQGEGWGLTTDGKWLYMSDGSEKIRVLDPATFKSVRTIEVYNHRKSVGMLNELEWIEGELWANIYLTDQIVRIDPQSGAVKGVIHMEGLLPNSLRDTNTDVLNGIAYDPQSKRVWVTGKNWKQLYEIAVIKQP